MLHGRLHDLLTRAGAAAILAACLLAWPGAAAARADAAQVTVVSPGGNQQTISLDALAGQEDVRDRAYALRSATGEGAQTVSGFSLAAILEAAGADPYGFSYLEAQRPAGGAVLLSRHQALDPAAFPDGPPVLYETAAGTGFLRPSSGPGDLNASDAFEAPQGVTLVLRKDTPLRVRAEASKLRTRPGETVSFTAIVERAGAGEELSYSWYFDDGHSAGGAEASHSFAKRGSYDVVLGVTTPGDSAGASAVVTIQVGEPLSGPDRKGGGTERDASAPDHGAATGSSSTSQPPAPSSRLCSDSETKCELDRGARRRAQAAAPVGEPISGMLLTGAETAPFEPAPAPAARTGKLEQQGGGTGLPGAALGLLVTAGLLGAGALIEVRR